MQTSMQIPTRRSPSWRRPSAIATTAAVTMLGLGMAAAPASASTYDWSVSCSQVTVDITGYNAQVVQIVKVTADGKELGTELTFRDDLHHTYPIPSHTKPLSIRLVVSPGSEDGQAVDETRTSPVCGWESASPTPSSPAGATTATATTEPTSTASSGTPSDASSTLSSPSPSSYISAPPLAETGASSSTPLIAGTAGAVVLAGAALLVVTRRRRSAQG
ncbi:LAETG motif-containing sortase-dependent surface protein [Streptomyces prunicolor]|uniref:LAETG motif-containing sortase-dependent surface protein n=1 Tax=Streptomyces prunicolor TaxID=67348 RepID=A0ABU4FB92_9ACTN|nr:LAETG motif-containing sortase-dependent surface protein [Streptomyces prunicolor]MDV7216560.1 LAETG motif-containing sortase-dependent surface protein [Streptomyces prunicolor]